MATPKIKINVRPVGPGRFRVRWDGPPGPGGRRNQRQKTFCADSAQEARRIALELYAEDWKHTLAPDNPTLARWLREWLDSKKGKVRAKSMYEARRHIELYILPYFGETMRLRDLRAIHVQRYYNWLLEHGGRNNGPLAPSSVRRIARTLQAAVNMAYELEMIPSSPVDRAQLPPEPRRGKRSRNSIWQDEDIAALLTKGTKDRYWPAIVVCLAAGLRGSELSGLKWADVEFTRQGAILRLRQAVHYVPKGADADAVRNQHYARIGDSQLFEVTLLKSDASHDRIPVPRFAAEALRVARRRQDKQRELPGFVDRGFVFTTATGMPIAVRQLQRGFDRFCRRYSFPRINLHATRHSAITGWATVADNELVLQKMARHASLDQTAEYMHSELMPQKMRLVRRWEKRIRKVKE